MAVIIVGCGIAGPVLAMLLKHKGFDPVLYDRLPEFQNAGGVSLALSPSTFKVLNILGLADEALKLGQPMENIEYRSEFSHKLLFTNDSLAQLHKRVGWPICGVARAPYNLFLLESARARGIPVHFGKKLVGVEQGAEGVVAVFGDGTRVEGEFLVGCDGLHSAARTALFGEEEASYTGLVQVGGRGPAPDFMLSPVPPTVLQVFGNGSHFISYPINSTERSWATTISEPVEAREDWRAFSKEQSAETIAALPTSEWANGPREIIANTETVTKYGLYDRPALPSWHKGRVVLCGDAAHPTSPHLGQGSNQAMEDCYHLVRLLVKHSPLTSEGLESAFVEYEQLRLPLVTALVRQARKEGETRTMQGEAACMRRDAMLAQGPTRESQELYMKAVEGPFTGPSEI